MIRLFVRKRFYSYERVVFVDGKVDSNADIIRYMRYTDKDLFGDKNPDVVVSPITDLTATEEEIQSKYDKDVRYEIRRAAKENVTYNVYDVLDEKEDLAMLKDIAEKYYDFCDNLKLPSMKNNLIFDEFLQFVKKGYIVITKGEYEGGWVYHIYQTDGKNAMLWFSFSDYRNTGKKQIAGWANRGLHNNDIMYFKSKGFTAYDWGNVASVDKPNNIDKFKMSFGGDLVTIYSSFVANTKKGKFFITLRKIKNKLTGK